MKDKSTEYYLADINTLIPYARNARTHSEEQVAQIAASIREFGLPDRWYVRTCLAGYRAFGFDPNYLERAIQESRGE